MSNYLQVLREHLRWLGEQPADYTNGIFDKAALVKMASEALESVKALEHAAEYVIRRTLSAEAWVSSICMFWQSQAQPIFSASIR